MSNRTYDVTLYTTTKFYKFELDKNTILELNDLLNSELQFIIFGYLFLNKNLITGLEIKYKGDFVRFRDLV